MASLKGWQGPCELLTRISPGTYRVNIRGSRDIFTSRGLKPYVPYKDDKKVRLHYYTDREGSIKTDDYVVERVLEDHVFRGKRQWRVKFRGFPEIEPQYQGSFMPNINDTWARYNRRRGTYVSQSHLR